jgi:DNA-binding Lrp family transcriptional regulator
MRNILSGCLRALHQPCGFPTEVACLDVPQGLLTGHHTCGVPVRGRLDSIDWAILKELQDDGSITNVELARRVGLSAPPCLRRVRALEAAGIIKAYRAMLDPKALGYEIVCFAMVQLDTQGKKELAAFQERIRDWALVRECWILSGDIDFILKCVASNLGAFQTFVSELTSLANVRNVRTALTLDLVKDEPLVPIDHEMLEKA